jgi:futalosine hydrolase
MASRILIAAATQQEIQPFLLSSPRHDIVITGVGIHAAVYQITQQLLHHHYDLVIQAGVAGAFAQSNLQPGAVVFVGQDTFGDAGLLHNGTFESLQQLGLQKDKEWLVNNHPVLQNEQLVKARAITVNTLSSEESWINALHQKWQPDIETMEGAALHYVCGKRGVPYLQIRAISNVVGDRNKNNWQLESAITNLNDTLNTLLPMLSS